MAPDTFDHKPDESDVLQVAGDIALDAIRVKLGLAGFEPDDYSVVISLELEDRIATCLHLPSEPDESKHAQAAFETQLLHLLASARTLGVRIGVMPMRPGTGNGHG